MKILVGNTLVPAPHLGKKQTVAAQAPVKAEDAAPVVTDSPKDEPVSIHANKTIPELKTFLDENKVEYPKTAKSQDLKDLADTVGADESDSI